MATTPRPSSNSNVITAESNLEPKEQVANFLVYIRKDGCTVKYTRVSDGSICRTLYEPNGEVFTTYIL